MPQPPPPPVTPPPRPPPPRPSQPPPQPPQYQPPPQPQPQQDPPPQPAQYPPPPYPYPHQYNPYPHHQRRPKRTSNTFASCLLATIFLAVIVISGVVTCFILFRPQDPEIALKSLKFPVFTLHNGTANFTLFQFLSLRNPNRFSFSHYDSSLQLLSPSTGPVGFIYIPAGHIAPRGTQHITATFDVRSFPLLGADPVGPGPGPGPTPTMELESKMKLVGTVKVLKVFAHHVEKAATCRVTIQISDGSVLGYHC